MPGIKITPADKYFSLCIRERAEWRCERCHTQYQNPTMALHCAHFHSRGHWSTRFDPSNAIALCMGCHLYTGSHREEHTKVHKGIVGELEFDRIWHDHLRPAHGMKKPKVKAEIAKHFRLELKRMTELRDSGVLGRIEFTAWEP